MARIRTDPSYDISRTGEVRNLVTGRKLKPYQGDKTGHLRVDLPSGRHYVHQLVTEAFIGPTPAGQEIRHLDNDATNNSLENLCYGTRSQNVLDLRSSRPHCPHGHEYTPENTAINALGHRRCRECKRRYRS